MDREGVASRFRGRMDKMPVDKCCCCFYHMNAKGVFFGTGSMCSSTCPGGFSRIDCIQMVFFDYWLSFVFVSLIFFLLPFFFFFFPLLLLVALV